MKKLVCLVLALVMCLSVVSFAGAESGYNALISYFGTNLGPGVLQEVEDQHTTALTVIFDYDSRIIMLLGRNEEDQQEAAVWSLEKSVDVMSVFAGLCITWEETAQQVDEGWNLLYVFLSEELEGPVLVPDAETAAKLAEIFVE